MTEQETKTLDEALNAPQEQDLQDEQVESPDEVQDAQDEQDEQVETTEESQDEHSEEGEETEDQLEMDEETSDNVEIDGTNYTREELSALVKSKGTLDKKLRSVNESVKYFEDHKNSVDYSQDQVAVFAKHIQTMADTMKSQIMSNQDLKQSLTQQGYSPEDILAYIDQNDAERTRVDQFLSDFIKGIETDLGSLNEPTKIDQTDFQKLQSLGSHLHTLYPDEFEGYTNASTIKSEWEMFGDVLKEYGFNQSETYTLLVGEPRVPVIRILKDLVDLKKTKTNKAPVNTKTKAVNKKVKNTNAHSPSPAGWPKGAAKTSEETAKREAFADAKIKSGEFTESQAISYINGWPLNKAN